MQPVEFVTEAKWIVGQFPKEAEEFFFNRGFELLLHESQQRSPNLIASAIQQGQSMVLFASEVAKRPVAAEIFRAFAIQDLCSPEWIAELTASVAAISDQESHSKARGMTLNVSLGWLAFKRCVAPVELLIIPREIQNETDFDGILTLELGKGAESRVSANHLIEFIHHVSKLYTDIAMLMGIDDPAPLTLRYAASGSLRLDFDDGGGNRGDVIKRVKELLVELWRQIRHRDALKLEQNSKSVSASLKTIVDIRNAQDHGHLSNKDAEQLTSKIVTSAIAIFNDGAKPREVKSIEQVENDELLRGLQTKLLPAPEQSRPALPTQAEQEARHRAAADSSNERKQRRRKNPD